jgi:hypothetical protein
MPSEPYEELPFCIVIRDDLLSKNSLVKQIQKQNYTNYKIIKIKDEAKEELNLNGNIIEIKTGDHSHYNYLKII